MCVSVCRVCFRCVSVLKGEAAGRRIAELVAELRALHGIVETGARDMEEAKDNLAELGA